MFSSSDPNTVLRHFQWMSEYGIDGVFLQRFGGQLTYANIREQRNIVTENVMRSAEEYGRVWAIMYDVTGTEEKGGDLVEILEKDWVELVDKIKVTQSSSYLDHNGLPVVGIWGLGFDDRDGTIDQALELLDFFQNNPNPQYRATVVGGVPLYWRTLLSNSRTDSAWSEYYCSLDVISPWTVGLYFSDSEVDAYQRTMLADMAKAESCGSEYMPVVYPGHSFHNIYGRPFNEYPRRGGNLYWRQVYSAIQAGVPMIYNAMFDEIDEGTAMFKIAETINDVPVGIDVVTMNVDGWCLPSDWYLQLAGKASQMLRGDIELTSAIPISPPEDGCK